MKTRKNQDTKNYMKHESYESDAMETQERKVGPKSEAGYNETAKKEDAAQKPVEKAAHLDHPQLASKHRLTNDMAYFLHHPQLGAKGAKMPPKNPKC